MCALKGERRMKMKKTTMYAIRIMLLLGNKEMKTISEIERILNVKSYYIKRIMRKLRNEGLIYSTRIYGGGHTLNKEAGNITLWDIFNCMEGDPGGNLPLDKEEKDYGFATKNKGSVQKVYEEIQKDLKEELSKYCIQDLSISGVAEYNSSH